MYNINMEINNSPNDTQAPTLIEGENTTWFKRHKVLTTVLGLFVFSLIITHFVPGLTSLFLLLFWGLIFIGVPWIIYETATGKSKTTSNLGVKIQENTGRARLRKVLIVIYLVCFVFSILVAFGSIFVFDGSDAMNIRYGVFLSAMILPITIILSSLFSKKSFIWFLLPILPLASLIYFNNSLIDYIGKSNEQFCKDAIARNDRSILDNQTSSCYKEAHSGGTGGN